MGLIGLLLVRRLLARLTARAHVLSAGRANRRVAEAAALNGARLAVLTQHAADVAMVMAASSRISFVSAACEPVLGRPVRRVQGRLATLLTDDVRGRPLVEALRTLPPGEVVRLVLERADGSPVWTETTVANRTDDPAVVARGAARGARRPAGRRSRPHRQARPPPPPRARPDRLIPQRFAPWRLPVTGSPDGSMRMQTTPRSNSQIVSVG